MEKLQQLSELQLAKLYNKTNDEEYIKRIDERITELHESNVDPNTLSNEQLVLLCQKYNDNIYWDALYNKTKNSIHFCIHKYANEFYKSEYTFSDDKESTDLFSNIRMGWFKAVETYNIVKGNAGFIAYASTLMYQHYVKLTRQVNQNHTGLSVNTIYVENVHTKRLGDAENVTFKSKMIDNVYTDETREDTRIYEAKEYVSQLLNDLKEHDEVMYRIIKLHYFDDLSQVQIAEIYGRNKTWVSRQIRKAKRYLRDSITDDEYLQILNDLK